MKCESYKIDRYSFITGRGVVRFECMNLKLVEGYYAVYRSTEYSKKDN